MDPGTEPRTALVTGGARGIGRAICDRLLGDGLRVTIIDVSERALAFAAELQAENPDTVRVLRASVTDRAAVGAVVAEILSEWGRLDVLVNNAGVNRGGGDSEMSEEDWDFVLDTNLKGSYFCSMAVAEPMAAQGGGAIVNIGSVAAAGGGGSTAYAASKAGLIGLTRNLATTLGPQGIRVNLVAPGPTNTPALRVLSAQSVDEIAESVPLRRLGEPEDVAAAVSFLASPDAIHITGQVLSVSGGGWMP